MIEKLYSLDRKKNAIRNTKWGIVEKIMILLLPFAIRTCLIYKLGIEYAGLNSLFSSILAILNLAELGVSRAIVYSMYSPIAQRDKNKICALLNFYKKTYIIIGFVVLIIGLSLMPFLSIFVKDKAPDNINIYLIYLTFLINSVLGYFFFSYKNCIISSYQREDIISKNSFILNNIFYIIQITIILFLKNYYLYILTIPLLTILINLVNYFTASRLFPDYIPKGELDILTKNELRKNIFGLLIGKIGGSTRNTLDSIIISSFFGIVAVGIYNNYFFVITSINGFLGIITNSILAGVGNKIVLESPQDNYLDFEKFHFFYMWLSGWCMVCLLCLYQPFMLIWVGEKLILPFSSVFLLSYYFLMLKQGDINSLYYQAAGLWYYGRWRSIIEAILNLILNILLGKLYGINGIIIATIISFTIVYFYGSSFTFTKYFKNGKLVRFYFENLYFCIISILNGLIFVYIFKYLKFSNLFVDLFIKSLICLVFPNLIFFVVFICNKNKRKHIFDIIFQIKRKLFIRG